MANSVLTNHPEVLRDHAADRRAARRSDRHGAAGQGPELRGHQLARSTSPPPGTSRSPRWSSRRPSGWSSTATTWSSCSIRSRGWPGPTTPKCPHSGKILSGGIDANALQQAEAVLRRGPQGRRRRLADDPRHRPDRHRQPDGRGDLRGVQGHRQHGARTSTAGWSTSASGRRSTSTARGTRREEMLMDPEELPPRLHPPPRAERHEPGRGDGAARPAGCARRRRTPSS